MQLVRHRQGASHKLSSSLSLTDLAAAISPARRGLKRRIPSELAFPPS